MMKLQHGEQCLQRRAARAANAHVLYLPRSSLVVRVQGLGVDSRFWCPFDSDPRNLTGTATMGISSCCNPAVASCAQQDYMPPLPALIPAPYPTTLLQASARPLRMSRTCASTNDTASSASSSGGSSGDSAASTVQTPTATLPRKALTTTDAGELADMLAEHGSTSISQADCVQYMALALERGNTALALSIHDSMCQTRRLSAVAGAGAGAAAPAKVGGLQWPAATVQTTTALVIALCRQLAIDEALRVISHLRTQGLPRNDAVSFGKVIPSPLAPSQTLTVVQPQEGCKLVADAFSRYEYEVFSGTVINTKSEALQQASGIWLTLMRASGFMRKPPPAAVHEFVVQAPDGVSRTFRVATATADVPAQVGERVTFVAAPSESALKTSRKKRQNTFFAPSPPGTKPGEGLMAVNHRCVCVCLLCTSHCKLPVLSTHPHTTGVCVCVCLPCTSHCKPPVLSTHTHTHNHTQSHTTTQDGRHYGPPPAARRGRADYPPGLGAAPHNGVGRWGCNCNCNSYITVMECNGRSLTSECR